mmetsp:Transcript_4168/g.13363  ORF Transcript_4168/g.13363 Transcript_4168/m.13363 type:complete len:164 (-) Transcript_4168:1862-2353(-)
MDSVAVGLPVARAAWVEAKAGKGAVPVKGPAVKLVGMEAVAQMVVLWAVQPEAAVQKESAVRRAAAAEQQTARVASPVVAVWAGALVAEMTAGRPAHLPVAAQTPISVGQWAVWTVEMTKLAVAAGTSGSKDEVVREKPAMKVPPPVAGDEPTAATKAPAGTA